MGLRLTLPDDAQGETVPLRILRMGLSVLLVVGAMALLLGLLWGLFSGAWNPVR